MATIQASITRDSYLKRIGIWNTLLLIGFFFNPFNQGFFFGYLLFLTILPQKQFIKRSFDRDFVFILLFSFVFTAFYTLRIDKGVQFILVYQLMPCTLFLWGKFLVERAIQIKELIIALLSIGIIVSLPSMISVLLNIAQGGFVQGSRSIPMFWNDRPINATGMAAPFIFNMCLPAILLVSGNNLKRFWKIILLIIFGLSMACVLRLGSRTQLLIFIITTLATLFYVVPRQSIKQNVTLVATIAAVIVLIAQNVSFDLNADWLNSYARRMEKGGAEDVASGGGRTDRWVKSLENLIDKPLGWDLHEFGHAHNLWLDALRVGTVFSFVLLVIITIRNLNKVYKIVKQNRNITLSVIFITYTLSFILLFMVEPILDGMFNLFAGFCFFFGVANKYYVKTSLC